VKTVSGKVVGHSLA